MLSEDKIKIIKKKVAEELSTCSAHNIDHVMRVYNLSLKLANREHKKIDFEVLQLATLLHDIGGEREVKDLTGKTDHAIESAKMAKPILEELKISQDKIKHIQDCIISHRFKNEYEPETIEAKILFDADKLDATGAIGIARAFCWVGKNKAHIYKKVDINEYAMENLCGKITGKIQDKSKHSPQIEYEIKTKFLAEKLFTDSARKICQERMIFFKEFLNRLEREINGEI